MPLHDFPLILVTRDLGDFHVGGALFFDEVLALHAKPERLAATVRGLARQILSKTSPLELHRRVAGATPELTHLSLSLDPPQNSLAWTRPIVLRLDVLRWRHAEEAWIAHLPALGIEVVAAREEQLNQLIPQHARVALARMGIVDRLFDLAQLARGDSIAIDRETISVDIATPAQIAAEKDKQADAKPVIADAGIVIDDAHAAPAYEIDALVDRLADALVGPRPRSVLLVGPSGVGKTAAFIELFRQRWRRRLGEVPFWMTSGARLVAGMSGFGLWQQRCQTLCREAKRDGAILHMGNLVELMEVGKAGGSQFGIASFFRPYLARGDVLAVAECTPEQLPLIERDNPHLLAVLQAITVEEPPPHVGRMILLNAALADGHPAGHRPTEPAAPITEEALDLLDRLHRRYATYSASPGRPLRFLTSLLRDRPALHDPATGAGKSAPPVGAADVTAAFSRETGLPSFLLDEAAPLDLPAARVHFASRVIGQEEAVDRVTDLLATVKAAMNRPKRPIASLLFIGPTGVGKTEMAKALADYFFGDRGDGSGSGNGGASAAGRGRLVRFDMSEFASPAAVARLVGTAWESEGLLTAKVREQPFCVLLLDEFEKAHPAFFDLLLQVLGEGRLTDSAGRLADFSNAIVVMTSNLGAESFGAGPFGLARATTPAATHVREHFTDAVRAFVRPELFNRIDRVIPFLPLGPAAIERIAAREIALISRRDGVRQRDLRLDASPAAVAHFARAGYDPVYGARPLKRRIERDLLAPLADSVNQYAPTTPLAARVDESDGRLTLTVRARRDEAATTAHPVHPPPVVLHPAAFTTQRRFVQAITRCPAALSVQNELFTLDRLIARNSAYLGRRTIDPVQHDRQKRLRTVADAIASSSAQVVALEDALLLHFYESAPLPFDPPDAGLALRRIYAAAHQLLLELLSLNQDDPHTITLALYGNAPRELFALAAAYRAVAIGPDTASVRVSYFTRLGKTTLQRLTLAGDETEAFLSQPRAGILGIVLSIHAPFARPRFETENGLHVIEDEKHHAAHPLLVDTSPDSSANYRPPKDVEFRVALAGKRRRTYIIDRGEVDDPVTAKSYRWAGRTMSDALAAAIDDHLTRRTEAILEG